MEDVSDPPSAPCASARRGHDVHGIHQLRGPHPRCRQSRQKLDIYEKERPIGIQIFGSEIDSMRRAAVLPSGPDVLDINYGCP